MEFKVGDVVEWCGYRTVVNYSDAHKVCVRVGNDNWRFFTDGRLLQEHDEPSLMPIERPKQKIKKYQILNKVNGEYKLTCIHFKSKEDFEKMAFET